MKNEADDPRRRLLIQMLAAGFFTGGSTASNLALAQILGSPPTKLPPGRSVYRTEIVLQAGVRLDLDALATAVRRVVARHEILRTVYDLVGGRVHAFSRRCSDRHETR